MYMKILLIISCFLICSAQAFSQWHRLPGRVEFTLTRIEQALKTGDPGSIEDLLSSGITMRLEDSLYQSISSISAFEKLKIFFADKDSIDFRFGLPGSGMMTYVQNGKRDTVSVDVWLKRSYEGAEIHAINISNYPIATVFFDIPRRKIDTK
jgi:hypothetical protein